MRAAINNMKDNINYAIVLNRSLVPENWQMRILSQ